MLITQKIKLFEDVESLLSKLHNEAKISRGEFSSYLRECEENSLFLHSASLRLIDISGFRSFNHIVELGKSIRLELDDYTGWRVYDRNMWLYWKKGSKDESKALEKPENWFEEVLSPPNKIYKLIKYNEEIEKAIKHNKIFYNIGMTIGGKALDISLDDMEDFESVVFLQNKKTKTRLYYGVWS